MVEVEWGGGQSELTVWGKEQIFLSHSICSLITMLWVPDCRQLHQWYSSKPTNSAVEAFGMNLPWFLAQSNPTEAGFAVKVPFNKADVVNP